MRVRPRVDLQRSTVTRVPKQTWTVSLVSQGTPPLISSTPACLNYYSLIKSSRLHLKVFIEYLPELSKMSNHTPSLLETLILLPILVVSLPILLILPADHFSAHLCRLQSFLQPISPPSSLLPRSIFSPCLSLAFPQTKPGWTTPYVAPRATYPIWISSPLFS